MKYPVLFSLALASFACNSHKELPQQKSFDSLFAMVKSCDSSYQSIAWDKVVEVERTVQADVQMLEASKKKFKKDKKELIEKYKALQWFGKSDDSNAINAFDQTQNKKFLRKQIDYSLSQITNLKADAEAENLKDDKLKEYIATERKAINDLYTFTKQKALNYQTCITQFEELKPQVDEMVNKK
jgi:hypothetical protein